MLEKTNSGLMQDRYFISMVTIGLKAPSRTHLVHVNKKCIQSILGNNLASQTIIFEFNILLRYG